MGGKGNKYSVKEAKETAYKILQQLTSIKKCELCGSIRRKKDWVGDIDIVVVPKNLNDFINSINELKDIIILSKGMRNIRLIQKENGIQIDFMIVSEDEFESARLHFTGSKYFNIRCRAKAKKLGYVLNEYGLWSNNGEIVERSENGILKALNMEKYLNPIYR